MARPGATAARSGSASRPVRRNPTPGRVRPCSVTVAATSFSKRHHGDSEKDDPACGAHTDTGRHIRMSDLGRFDRPSAHSTNNSLVTRTIATGHGNTATGSSGTTGRTCGQWKTPLPFSLGFYLASWGMYRGSSFLLQHVYTAHVPVVRAVAASQFSALWQRDVGANDGDTDLAPTILALARSVTAAYEPFGTATDTLATKVILGTIGCLPACDRFFIKGFRTEGFQFSYLNAHFVDRILHYCIAHRLELAEQQATITARGGLEYPLMKLVDMHFWQIGYEMNQSSARRGDGSRPLPAAGER